MATVIFIVWLGCVIVLLWRNRVLLSLLWAEPVLRRPVLIIESDDWGAGPLAQTEALQKLSVLLSKFSDSDGRHPKMTLGMVLAIADTETMKAEGLKCYRRLTLDDECFTELRQAIADGIESGVFVAQLHGMEHYWPPALMQAANNNDETVRQWLTGDSLPKTEELPSALQSRWVDASVLPAQQLDSQVISAMVSEELALYKKIFHGIPQVVVPPTFVWNQRVENSWAYAGVEVVVTPGQCYESRDSQGIPCAVSKPNFNGERAESGINYIVRNDYFEPSLGHEPERAMLALSRKTTAGRPTLLETHRFNFIGEPQKTEPALRAISTLLAAVLSQYSTLAFLSTGQLAQVLARRDKYWVNDQFFVRICTWLERLSQDYRLRRFFLLSGLVVPHILLRKFFLKKPGMIRGGRSPDV